MAAPPFAVTTPMFFGNLEVGFLNFKSNKPSFCNFSFNNKNFSNKSPRPTSSTDLQTI